MTTNTIDRRADMVACLTHNIRRDIRDCLRQHGSLTLHELSHHLSLPIPNLYYHLELMVKHGVVEKELVKVNGRTISVYKLSDEYNQLFSEQPTKPDLTPIHTLFLTYVVFTLCSIFFGNWLLPILKPLGVITTNQLVSIGLVGLLTTLIPIIYYNFRFNEIDITKFLPHGIFRRW